MKKESVGTCNGDHRASYLILHPRRATFANLLRFLLSSTTVPLNRSLSRLDLDFIDFGYSSTATDIDIYDDLEKEEEEEEEERFGPVLDDHRWVIVVSVVARKVIMAAGKPMKWVGMLLEFFLNLLTLNSGLFSTFIKAFNGILLDPFPFPPPLFMIR